MLSSTKYNVITKGILEEIKTIAAKWVKRVTDEDSGTHSPVLDFETLLI